MPSTDVITNLQAYVDKAILKHNIPAIRPWGLDPANHLILHSFQPK